MTELPRGEGQSLVLTLSGVDVSEEAHCQKGTRFHLWHFPPLNCPLGCCFKHCGGSMLEPVWGYVSWYILIKGHVRLWEMPTYDSMKRASGCGTLVGEHIQPHQEFPSSSSIIHCNMTCLEPVFRETEAGCYINHKHALRAHEGSVLQFTAKYSDSHLTVCSEIWDVYSAVTGTTDNLVPDV